MQCYANCYANCYAKRGFAPFVANDVHWQALLITTIYSSFHVQIILPTTLPRNAMTCLRVLLLVAVMASSAGPDAGPAKCWSSQSGGVTRFVCVNCTATGHLSSRWLFLNRAGVRRHIAGSKACIAAESARSPPRTVASKRFTWRLGLVT